MNDSTGSGNRSDRTHPVFYDPMPGVPGFVSPFFLLLLFFPWGHMGHLDPIFRKVLRKKCTEKRSRKTPSMCPMCPRDGFSRPAALHHTGQTGVTNQQQPTVAPLRGTPVRPGEIFCCARTLLEKNMQNFPENFPKIFKIYFSNVFSMKNYFLDHAAFTNFFSDPVQEQ